MEPNLDLLAKAAVVIEDFDNQIELCRNDIKRFDLGSWITTEVWTGDRYVPHPCGTSACAMGLLASHPAFIKLGLELSNGVPIVHGKTQSYYAMANFFGISQDVFDGFFMPSSYLDRIELEANWKSYNEGWDDFTDYWNEAVAKIRPADVAKKIRAYVADWLANPGHD